MVTEDNVQLRSRAQIRMSAAMIPRSILFVPGDRPDRFDKALAAGADAVCLDLEDAVGTGHKAHARKAVAHFLNGAVEDGRTAATAASAGSVGASSTGPLHLVRINDPGSDEGARDLAMLTTIAEDAKGDHVCAPVALMIPKLRRASDLQRVADHACGAPLFPLVETVAGLANASRIATATPGVVALVFGGFDLAVELGAEPEWEPLLYARSRVVHAAALAGVAAIDMPSREIRNLVPIEEPASQFMHKTVSVQEEAMRAGKLGFVGKIAIHPAQIEPIHRAFAPSAEELRRARCIVEADDRAEGAALSLDGTMVDRPVVEVARRVLARADRAQVDLP